MSDETKKQIGDYEILEELGSGGMGRVCRVRNLISDRIEAMKVLLPDLAGRQELAARFLREIKLLASLNHPNIAALRTALTVDNQLVMIMEYVQGTTLASRLERGPIPVAEALNYIDQALDALSYAHKQGIIHRDIKPANMMLTPQGVVKLMDFGIARSGEDRTLTQTGTTMGSLSYMSPEQVKGETTDARSDLYSVGVSLYEMVTGQRPFQSGSDYSIMAAHVRETPKTPLELQPGLPAALNEIIMMAIAKDPASRFQSADAFRNALSVVREQVRGAKAVAVDAHDAPTATLQVPTPVAPPAKSTSTPGLSPAASVPPAAAQSSHRGLYITLGAVIVLAILVAAGIYVPRHSKTQAETSGATVAPIQSPPAAQTEVPAPAVAQPPQVPDATPPGAEDAAIREKSSEPQSKPVVSNNSSEKQAGTVPQAGAVAEDASSAAASAAAPNAADLDELEQQVDQLTSRVGAVNSSLDTLQRAQNAQGYGLRGDISSRQESMKVNLQKAQRAVEQGDTVRARRYIELTQADVEALERFLGR